MFVWTFEGIIAAVGVIIAAFFLIAYGVLWLICAIERKIKRKKKKH